MSSISLVRRGWVPVCGEQNQLRVVLPVLSFPTDHLPTKAWEIRIVELGEICGSRTPVSSQVWAVTDDGKLVRENWEEEELACVQQVQGSNGLLAWTCPPNTSCQGGNSSMYLECEVDAQRNASHHQLLIVDTICILVSLGGLLVTFLVYSILPMFHTLHGHVVRMNLISMILFKISLLVIFHATSYLPDVVCTILGFFTYFCSIAMFSWITVMCFDLHQTFTSAKMASSMSTRRRKIFYGIFALGLSLLSSVSLFTIQETVSEESDYHPTVGKDHCFLAEGSPRVIFFHVPVLVLMTVNSLMFAWMVRAILITKLAIRAARNASSVASVYADTRDHLALYVKLLVVLGLLWILEGTRALITYFDDHREEEGAFSFYFFKIVDTLNLLRGVFIFIIFVCKRKVWESINIYRMGARSALPRTGIPRSYTTATLTCEQTTAV